MELRIARHTSDIKLLSEFYINILGLSVLFSFENHNGYNGVMIGKSEYHWHLEFTSSKRPTNHQFDIEDLLVFYPTEQKEYDQIIERIEAADIKKIIPENPYWIENGVMIQDPDGYGIIISDFKLK